jgi:hypothetical protein
MDDFSSEAVECFVDSLYTGGIEKLDKGIFEEVNKMAHAFQVKWLSRKCVQFFQSDILRFESKSYDEILFACEIASRAHENLNHSKFVNLFIKNMRSRDIGKRTFLRRYMMNFPEMSRRQISMSLEIAKRDMNILFDILVSYLTFGLKLSGFDENSLYLLQQVPIKQYQQKYPEQFTEVVSLITEVAEGSKSVGVTEVVKKFIDRRSEDVVDIEVESYESSDSCDEEESLQNNKTVAIQTDEHQTEEHQKGNCENARDFLTFTEL